VAHLVLERVGKRFGAGGDRPEAVKDVSFSVERGDFISIVGHSGSGKTTLLSILGGMARPSSGAGDRADAYPSQLSGGQQRRVAIARAFMNAPSLVLADEPTGDLDEQTEAEVMGLFTRMNRERGTTFVMVTHNSELAGRAGRRMRMQDGRIREL
jgi:ABC-type lipoprotein export system ATPase subunit